MFRQLIVTITASCFMALTSLKAQSLYFPPVSGNSWDTTAPNLLGWCADKIDSLDVFLRQNDTRAFILLQDGKIVLERYYAGHQMSSLWYWASAGKTLTAFLTGIAVQEGKLKLSDTTAKYLGRGWTNCSAAAEARITIQHQLTMTTGLDDNVPDPYCTLDTCLNCLAAPGSRWAYHNGPYTLLDPVIEQATGVTLNAFHTQKVKLLTGMTGSFAAQGYNNVYFSNARSMARFGLLLLNRGTWNQTAVLRDTAYFRQMTNSSQSMNPAYGYLTWLNGKSSFMVPGSQLRIPGTFFPDAPADAFAALGKDGQFINVVPSKRLVWIRMGSAPQSTLVPFQLNNEIWKYINRLPCPGSAVHTVQPSPLRVWPNPADGKVQVEIPEKNGVVSVFDFSGRRVFGPISMQGNTAVLQLGHLPAGSYRMMVQGSQGHYTSKLMLHVED
ncbi:MAG: hypothetical protein RLZZ370_610 [Bacteroidota bacterium]